MKRFPFLFALALLLGSASVYISTASWTSAPDGYSVSFKGGKIEGTFTGLKSELILDKDASKNSIKASIETGTINTGNGMRDEHAKAENALNAEKYQQILFESSAVEKKNNKYFATGTLSMKGVAKTVTIPFTFSETGKKAVLTGSFTVKPKEYNVERGGTPEEVTITLNIPYNS